jgi:uncharacterized protein (DUF1330 family)
MAAYLISELEVLDEAQAAEYRSRAAASIAQYGGRYLARNATPHLVEGGPSPGNHRFVIVEFPSMARAREWYASAAYAEALKFRVKALERRLIFVEGVPPPVAAE